MARKTSFVTCVFEFFISFSLLILAVYWMKMFHIGFIETGNKKTHP